MWTLTLYFLNGKSKVHRYRSIFEAVSVGDEFTENNSDAWYAEVFGKPDRSPD